MKRPLVILFLAAASVLLLTAFSTFAAQQRVVRLTRYEGRSITGVNVSSGFDVYLVQSTQTRVVAEVSEALEGYLDLSLDDNGIVHVSLHSQRGFRGIIVRNAILKLTVYLPTLTRLTASGGADVTGRGTFSSDELNISMSGGADLNALDVQTGFLTVLVSGGADTELSGQADELEVSVSGGADADLKVKCRTAKATVSGGADLGLSGNAEEATFSAMGGAELDAGDFAVKRLKVTANGVGGASVWAIDELQATASGAGSVRYRGNPQQLDNRASSAGSIRKVEN